ncbi:MAG: HNH endonuclease [Acidimicrobiales bacterium]
MAIAEDFEPVHPRDWVWVNDGVTDLMLADMSIDIATAILEETAAATAIILIHNYQERLSAVETKLLAARTDAGHSDHSNERLIHNSGKLTKSETRKRSQRASTVAKNKELGSSHEEGELSTEQLDAIAWASSRTDSAAATDPRFIARVKAANPDLAHMLGRSHVSDHQAEQNKTQSEHDRQQVLRNARRYQTHAGTKVLQLEGPQSTIDLMWGRLVSDADQLYRNDGGRDLAGEKHPRTHVQRLFDAAHHVLGRSRATNETGGRTRGSSGSGRSSVVATFDIRDLSSDPAELARLTGELIGTGRIPKTVLEHLACTSDWAGLVFGADGEILWHGRTHRHATPAQWKALVVRDKGCVLCGARANRCEGHHLIPWNAPAKGQTNIDGLALVCVDCHHRIHDTRQTLCHDPTGGTWKLRPATRAESPPPRPHHREAPARE